MRAARYFDGNVFVIYGATEIGGISIADVNDIEAHEDSVGRACPGVSIQILDDEGFVAPFGSRGLIGIRSAACIDGYLDNDVLNERHFKSGWFCPGDIGTLLEGGLLLFHGRADEMMILNGINIFPEEIERVAEKLDGVIDCAAFSVVSEVHGSIPILAVVLDEMQNDSLILKMCREHLGLRAPRKVVAVDKIPRNFQGKILRRTLASDFASFKSANRNADAV